MTPFIFCAGNVTITDPYGGFQVCFAVILIGHDTSIFLSSPGTYHIKHMEGEKFGCLSRERKNHICLTLIFYLIMRAKGHCGFGTKYRKRLALFLSQECRPARRLSGGLYPGVSLVRGNIGCPYFWFSLNGNSSFKSSRTCSTSEPRIRFLLV